MRTHNNINISHIEEFKKYNERLRELLANSDDYIHMISDFVDSGIAPPETFFTSTEKLSYNLKFFSDLAFVLSEIITTMEEASIDTKKNDMEIWNKLLSISQELINIETYFSQHTDDFCEALSTSSSIADYWCAQKWLGGKSNFSPLSNSLSNICTQLFYDYQSYMKQIIISQISIAEANIRVISDEVNNIKSLINVLPYTKDPINITSPKISEQDNFSKVKSDNLVHPKEIIFTPVPTSPGTPVYIHVNGITYQNGIIQYQNLIDSKDAPRYANIPQSYWKQCKRHLSVNEIQKLLADISVISLYPLYEAMISDTYGATPGFDGASYKIFEIHYSDGQHFRFEMHRSIPKEYFSICETLSSFCIQSRKQSPPLKLLAGLFKKRS